MLSAQEELGRALRAVPPTRVEALLLLLLLQLVRPALPVTAG